MLSKWGSLTKRLEKLKTRHEIIGDVRNLGVFGTIEFVKIGNQNMTPMGPTAQRTRFSVAYGQP